MYSYAIINQAKAARLLTLVGAAALCLGSAGSGLALARGQTKPCKGGLVNIARGVEVVEAWRGYKGADGQSHLERVKIPGKHSVHYDGKVRVTVFDLGDPSGAAFVYGEPNMEIPVHPVPYKETFIILSGSSEVQMPDGQVVHLSPGSMLMSEDLDTPGRGGRSGPCGYVALSLAYKAQK